MNEHSFFVHMSKLETKKKAKRLRIINAAVSVIAKYGYHAAPVSKIAEEAQVPVGSIYAFFPDGKEQVLLCIFEEKLLQLIAYAREQISNVSDPIGKIEVFLRVHLEHLQDHPELAQVFQVELRQSQRFFHGYRLQTLFAYIGLLGSAIVEAQEKNFIDPSVDSKLLQWSIFGALDELSINWVLSEKVWPQNLQEIPQQLMRIFIDGVRVR
jgi:TetR/AcrR family fatty acid metabolism transcriptional regulator